VVAAGRSEQAIESLTRWPEAAGFVVLAAALVCLGSLCRSAAGLPVRLALVAYGEAALFVGIALAGIMQTGTPYDVFSLVTGALVGPVLAFWLGHHLRSGRVERAPGTAAAPI
jgi:membrane protein DedA with SNARE-associated domain